jgi:hypothetical protein
MTDNDTRRLAERISELERKLADRAKPSTAERHAERIREGREGGDGGGWRAM